VDLQNNLTQVQCKKLAGTWSSQTHRICCRQQKFDWNI